MDIGVKRQFFWIHQRITAPNFDPAWDADFAVRLNRDAKWEEDYGNEITPAEVKRISEMLDLMVASSAV